MFKWKFNLLIIFVLSSLVYGQSAEQQYDKYRNEPLGNKLYKKRGVLQGNLVRSVFENTGELGYWVDGAAITNSGEWPKGSKHSYIDGCTPIVTARTVAPGNNNVIHPAEGAYREEVDKDPVTNEEWVTRPVPGYVNPSSESPAISTNAKTWPPSWSRALPLVDDTWDGFWYGYFGKKANADEETFYVIDDSKDREYTRPPYSYFPIASMPDRGGLGIRVEIRGLQWVNVLAEDIIFWHYDIYNLADAGYDSTYFGFYCDTGVGGYYDANSGDFASYDKTLDIAYAFNDPPMGGPMSERFKTGVIGYAFLQSPGNASNGFDDDEDGMVNEDMNDGIDNNNDWLPFEDINGNGVWDADIKEPLRSDVGKDGLGPFDIEYEAPDEGEGDGLPTTGEPNFDTTDKDESDQIGLTSLAIQRLAGKGNKDIWLKNDDVIYQRFQISQFDTILANANIQILFGSGAFPLGRNDNERFSVALAFGDDLADLVFNKETVQQIYNADYNFSRPPNKPTLKAVEGDGQVSLFWNDISEKSFDPFLNKMDFEGYMILRSREPEFQDVKIITDSKGSEKYYKPIAQFDVVNGIKGPDPVGVNGAHFWRGDDTGLQHSYIDKDVVNGQVYYYALVAYDQGDPDRGTKGLIPTETTKIIEADEAGNITRIDINCAMVTPNSPAAGYNASQITNLSDPQGLGTGSLAVTVINGGEIKDGANYKVNFVSSNENIKSGSKTNYRTTNYFVTRELNGVVDTLHEAAADSSTFGSGLLGTPFDGIALSIMNYDSLTASSERTGWIRGFSNYNLHAVPDTGVIKAKNNDLRIPADYQLEFVTMGSVTTTYTKIPINFVAKNITSGDTVEVEIFDINKSKAFDLGDVIILLEKINNKLIYAWKIKWEGPTNAPFASPPVAGDIFQLATNKPFATGDYISFSTKSARVDLDSAKNKLDNVGVVPNPYVVTNKWEKQTVAESGRGERRIDFINLPSQCTVRIYTITGALIKTLYKDSAPTDGSLTWNLVTDDGMDIAYGIYIYHLDAPGVGEKIGKFAVIK
ncbi:MAG: hypothetical protein IPM32_17490 [Ignavibacteriae bacterium]|nr:hypothetical protein [Ignavibacteriota bacterium]